LNYEAQIKIGYDSTPQPILSFDPFTPIPAHVAAGLSFRLSGTDPDDATAVGLLESNSYGISFLRGNGNLNSGIPDDIIPMIDLTHFSGQTISDFPAIFEKPELGLHTFGDGAENVFFLMTLASN
jgi:hypothetical protein